MATFDYAGLKAEVDALLVEFGQDCIIRRQSAATVDPVTGAVTPGATTNIPVVGCITDYADKLIDGTNIKRGDRLVYIQAVTPPKQGDLFIEANGTQWAMVDFDAVDPAGLALVYALQLRR